jgi:hypothetical protein
MTFRHRLYNLELAWIERWLPLRQAIPALKRIPAYINDWRRYERLSGNRLGLRESYPCLFDNISASPTAGHYFHQAVWAAQKIANAKTNLHIDIGSDVRFVGMLASFLPVIFVDIRPLKADITHLHSLASDILRLPFSPASVLSISCLHVAEHIGLGRYGDPLNPDGTRQAACELARVLAPGGNLYFSLPIGKPRICFNAHRIHDPFEILSYFQGLDLVEFSAENDQGIFRNHVQIKEIQTAEYSCGMFHFRRP